MSAIEHPSTTAELSQRMRRTTVAQLALRAIHRWQRNRALGELRRLDDRLLADAGISRHDIPKVVAGLYPGQEASAGRTVTPATPPAARAETRSRRPARAGRPQGI